MRLRRTCAALGVALAGVTAGLLAAAGPAHAADQQPNGPVQLVSTAANSGLGFYETPTGSVDMRTFTGTTWSAPTDLGGNVVGVSAAQQDTTHVLLGATGTDDALWNRLGTLSGGTWTWSPWRKVGGSTESGPSLAKAAGTADGVRGIEVAVTGTDGAVYTTTRELNGTWDPWVSWGGQAIREPALTDAGGIYVLGADHHVWNRVSGQGWTSLGGAAVDPPAATFAFLASHGWVSVSGTDGRLYVKECTPGAVCGAWTSPGNTAAVGTPGLSMVSGGTTQIVVRSAVGGDFFQSSAAGDTFGHWTEILTAG